MDDSRDAKQLERDGERLTAEAQAADPRLVVVGLFRLRGGPLPGSEFGAVPGWAQP